MKKFLITRRQSELPLKYDRANFFLEVSTTISVFLFSLVLAAYFLINSMILSWNNSIANGLTVQIMPAENALTADEEVLYVNKVVHFFEAQDNVSKVILINDEQMNRLMSPWIGNHVDISSLPLPKLLDVRLKKNAKFDYDQTAQNLKDIAPYASIDSHGMWLQKLVHFASTLRILSLFILLLVLSVTAFAIFYAVETSLKVHKNIIEILHIMGATDSYIAKQYASRSFFVGLFSGIIGLVAGLIVIMTISHIATSLQTGLLESVNFGGYSWFCIISLPLWTAILSMCTAYVSVKQSLGKII